MDRMARVTFLLHNLIYFLRFDIVFVLIIQRGGKIVCNRLFKQNLIQ